MRALVVLIAAAILAGCGARASDEEQPGALAMPDHYGPGEIAKVVGDEDRDHLVKIDGVQCEIQDYLTSAGSVSLYADAGDVVATNPSQTAGIVITGERQERCFELFTEALAEL